jgi:hypothetical protein
MWKIFEHNCDVGTWKAGEQHQNAENAKVALNNARSSNKDTFVFWDGEIPVDRAAQDQILQRSFELNGESLLRIMLGVEISRKAGTMQTLCSGDCFCVVANGSRGCETQYCNSAGWCWWVSCGTSC